MFGRPTASLSCWIRSSWGTSSVRWAKSFGELINHLAPRKYLIIFNIFKYTLQ